MERRGAKRYPRRLRVAVTELATCAKVDGFTGNISTSGVFVTCSRVVNVGERVRLELGTEEPALVLYGIVARQIRVPPALRSVQREGMGIRFLRVSELVRDFLPDQAREEAEDEGKKSPPPADTSERANQAPSVETEAARSKPKSDAQRSISEKKRTSRSAPKKPARPDPPGVYRVTVEDREELRKRYEEEIRFGGMSVKAKRPPERGEHVTVLVDLATSNEEPLPVKAEVVLVHDDGTFGVQFSDSSRFLFAIKRLF